MLKIISYLFIISLLTSCSKSEEIFYENVNKIPHLKSTVKPRTLFEKDEHLAPKVDFYDPNLVESLTDSEIAELKVIIYRFYNTVEIIEGNYVTKIRKGKEIKISEDIFNILKENLDQLNIQANNLHQEGNIVDKPEVNTIYLESLLE